MENKKTRFEDLPKYIKIDTGEDELFYHPIVFKWEWEGHSNAYYAMYARCYNGTGNFNPSQVLFHVSAPSYEDAVEKFLEEYERKRKYVKGGYWIGDNPKIIDLLNMRVDRFFKVRNVKKPKSIK